MRVLICLLALAVVTPSAAASTYSGQATAPSYVQTLARKADRFWADRHVPACASTRAVLMAPSLMDSDGIDADGRAAPASWEDGCTVWVASYMLADPLRLCTVIFHEAGHTGGLEHTADGLMSPEAGAAPWECRVWARHREAREWRRSWR